MITGVAARAVALAAALAAGLGGTALADRLPALPPAGAAADAPTPLDLPAAVPTLACPGPETAVVPGGGSRVRAPGLTATTVAADGPDAGAVRLGPLTGRASTPLPGGSVRVLFDPGAPGRPQRLVPGPVAGAVRLAAVQATLGRSGDLRGLAAGACGTATGDAWIVGGETGTGRRASLLLTNAASAPAVVDVRLAGPDGPVDTPGARGLVVAPGQVRAVALGALAPAAGPLAVHVVARSGRVGALLHTARLRGAVPDGVDDVSPSAAPARSLVVPGVSVLPGGRARLRIAATTAAEAVVRYRVVGVAGEEAQPGSGVVTVPAGGVAEVPLTLRPGHYAAWLDADTPVVAGAVLTVAGPPRGALRTVASDLAWVPATGLLSGKVAGAVPRPVDARPDGSSRPVTATVLVVTPGPRAAGDADVLLREIDVLGHSHRLSTVRVRAGLAAGVPLAPGTAAFVLTVPPGAPLHAGLVTSVPDPAGALVTAVPVQPAVVASRVAPPAVEDPRLASR